MSSLRRALWALAGAGVLLGLALAALIATNDRLELRGVWIAAVLVVGWAWLGTGLFAWNRRPDNRVGMLMAATGLTWLVASGSFSDLPFVFTLGNALGACFFAIAMHLLLAFPTGRLRNVFERRVIGLSYLVTTIGVLPLWFFVDPAEEDCAECPANLLLIERNETLVSIWGTLLNAGAVALVGAVLFVLVRRWRSATPSQRRLVMPVYSAGIIVLALLIVTVALAASGLNQGAALDAIWITAMVSFGLVPFMFLVTLIRARMIQSGAVGELISRLSEAPRRGELRDALARALGDPTIELVYWLPDRERFVDARGHPVDLPDPPSGRAATKVERDGDCVAAIIHDAMLLEEERGFVDAVGGAAALALENERLDAEVRAKVEELRASRERMLRIGLEERRRLERDLHDGAQQRLVSMALSMRMARDRVHEDPDGADRLLDAAGEELEAALEELRELARGIHPAVLSDRGLSTAIETLAARAPVPVELERMPGERLPEAVELAAYFVVSEALTNVAKYAAASHATVNVERENGRLVVEVADDGVGGANPNDGTGLRGLADRLGVIEGRLEIDSEPGAGTRITARIPCE